MGVGCRSSSTSWPSGCSTELHLPTVRRINAILVETAGGSQASAAELDKLGKKAGMVGGLLNLITVVIVVLMVFKPGFP